MYNVGIYKSLVMLKKDEGANVAAEKAEAWRDAIDGMMKVATHDEYRFLRLLSICLRSFIVNHCRIEFVVEEVRGKKHD